jgi:putative transcriptional regulator
MINHLKAIRTAAGMTQADLAARVGVSRQAIIAIESDQHDPSLALAYKLSSLFDMPVEGIFPNPNTIPPTP